MALNVENYKYAGLIKDCSGKAMVTSNQDSTRVLYFWDGKEDWCLQSFQLRGTGAKKIFLHITAPSLEYRSAD